MLSIFKDNVLYQMNMKENTVNRFKCKYVFDKEIQVFLMILRFVFGR